MMMPRMDVTKKTLSQSLWLFLIIISCLLLLSWLPEINRGDFHLRKIDILSDLHPDEEIPSTSDEAQPDTLAVKKNQTKVFDPENTPITHIEDYSGEEKILSHFYDAIQNADVDQIRIGFFGDSFIEGDIISASLRDTLQKTFGGNGVGLVPLATEVSGFRKSIKHTFNNWNVHSLLNSTDAGIPIGISGYAYTPELNNTVSYKPGKTPLQEKFRTMKLFYQNTGSATIHYSINDEPELNAKLEKSNNIKSFTLTHPGMQSIEFRIAPADSIVVFGVSIENNRGIYVDNFSMRRNSGVALSKLSPSMLKQFNHYLNYKLIILQYGLNVASEKDSTNYGWYTGKMIKIIKDLKEVFPETSFLLLSVSDRGVNKDGKIVTMDGIPKMRDMQREIARKSGIAFWDMFEAMGGKNSIVNYTESEPPLASKDYTHLTHLGGNIIGRKLADALLYEINKHEKNTHTP